MIRKEVFLTPAVRRECRRIIAESEIMKEDDNNWPEPDRIGRQELEIVKGNEHISFTTSKIWSLVDVQSSNDPEGLRTFYYLVQSLCKHKRSILQTCNARISSSFKAQKYLRALTSMRSLRIRSIKMGIE